MAVGNEILHRVNVVHKLEKAFFLTSALFLKNNTKDFLVEAFKIVLKCRVIFFKGSGHFSLR